GVEDENARQRGVDHFGAEAAPLRIHVIKEDSRAHGDDQGQVLVGVVPVRDRAGGARAAGAAASSAAGTGRQAEGQDRGEAPLQVGHASFSFSPYPWPREGGGFKKDGIGRGDGREPLASRRPPSLRSRSRRAGSG